MLDVARDGHISIDARKTRSEQASAVTAAVVGKEGKEGIDAEPIVETARKADASVFGGGDIGDTSLAETWRSAEAAKSAIRRASTRRSRFSLKSFGKRRKSKPPRKERGGRRKWISLVRTTDLREQRERASAESVYPPKRPSEEVGNS